MKKQKKKKKGELKEPASASTEPQSKRQRHEEDEEEIKAFVAQLAERDIEIGDMDPNLLSQLKSSKRA